MKNILKKAAIVAFAASVSFVPVNAQEKGDFAVGGNVMLGYGNDIFEGGLGAKFLYNVSDPLRLAGEFDILWGIGVKTEGGLGTLTTTTTWKEFSVYGHYLFQISTQKGNIAVYPLVGIGFVDLKTQVKLKVLNVTEKASATESKFMFTLGGGIERAINEKFSSNVELRIKIVDEGIRLQMAYGITYKF